MACACPTSVLLSLVQKSQEAPSCGKQPLAGPQNGTCFFQCVDYNQLTEGSLLFCLMQSSGEAGAGQQGAALQQCSGPKAGQRPG